MSSELEKRRREHYLRSKAPVADPQFEISLEKLKSLESNWHSARLQINTEKIGSGVGHPEVLSQSLRFQSENEDHSQISQRIQPIFTGVVQSERTLNTQVLEISNQSNTLRSKDEGQLLEPSKQSWKSPPVPKVILNSPNSQGTSLKDSLTFGPEFAVLASARVGSPKHQQLASEGRTEVSSARLFGASKPSIPQSGLVEDKLDIQKAFEELEAFKSKLHGAKKLNQPGSLAQTPVLKTQEKHESSLRSPKTQPKPSKPHPLGLKHTALHPASSPSPKSKPISSPKPRRLAATDKPQTQTTATATTTTTQQTTASQTTEKTQTPPQTTTANTTAHKRQAVSPRKPPPGVVGTVGAGGLPLKDGRTVAKHRVLTGGPVASQSLQKQGHSIWVQFENELKAFQASAGTNVPTDTLHAAFNQFMAAVARQAPAEQQ